MNHIGTIKLETDRLILRRFNIDDAREMFYNWASDEEVVKYLTWSPHKNVEVTEEFINSCIQGYEKSEFYQWVLEIKETHELIGSISVTKVIDEISSMELGWVIGRKYWGKGYTAEAAKAIIAMFFDKVGVNCIYACHDVDNINSGRVMRKVGMKYEGTLRQNMKNNRGIVDSMRYSILRADK